MGPDAGQNLFLGKRLNNVIDRACLKRSYQTLNIAIDGDEDYGNRLIRFIFPKTSSASNPPIPGIQISSKTGQDQPWR